MAFIERTLAALAAVDLTGPEKLVTVGLFSGVVRLFAQTGISQRQAGQDTAQWQNSLGGYLLAIAAAGQHPHQGAQRGTRSGIAPSCAAGPRAAGCGIRVPAQPPGRH